MTLKLFIEGHPQTAKVPHQGHFWLFGDIFTLNADYIKCKLLKMALEVEYMMKYQHPGLLVTEDCWLQRKPADSTVLDRKKAVVITRRALAQEGDYKMHPVRALVCHTDFSKTATATDFL